MKNLQALSFILCSLCFYGCEEAPGGELVQVVIQNDAPKAMNDLSDHFHRIDIPSSLETEISGIVRTFVYHEGVLYLVDRSGEGLIFALDKDGELLFTLRGNEDPLTSFSSIWTFYLDQYQDQLVIFDQRRFKKYKYSLKGEFLDVERVRFNMNDAIGLQEGSVLYDVSSYPVDEDERSDKKVGVMLQPEQGDTLMKVVKNNYIYQSWAVPFLDFENFFEVGGSLFYHQDFTDTVYVYDEGLFPEFTFKFSTNDLRQELLLDSQQPMILQACLDQNVPYSSYVIEIGGKVYANYIYDFQNYFVVLDRSTNKHLVNGNIFVHEGRYFKGRINHKNGIFLNQMYENDFRILQERKGDLPEEMESDQGGVMYTIFVPK